MEEDSERRGFRVTDRRRFTGGEGAADAPADVEPPRGEAAGEAPPPESEREPPAPVTFATFVLGLSTQALFHLGEVADPAVGVATPNLGAAKHVIDILGILQDKTRNNLDSGEADMLEAMLYDLRVRYVELVRRGAGKERP